MKIILTQSDLITLIATNFRLTAEEINIADDVEVAVEIPASILGLQSEPAPEPAKRATRTQSKKAAKAPTVTEKKAVAKQDELKSVEDSLADLNDDEESEDEAVASKDAKPPFDTSSSTKADLDDSDEEDLDFK